MNLQITPGEGKLQLRPSKCKKISRLKYLGFILSTTAILRKIDAAIDYIDQYQYDEELYYQMQLKEDTLNEFFARTGGKKYAIEYYEEYVDGTLL
jgi:hypothetical protein